MMHPLNDVHKSKAIYSVTNIQHIAGNDVCGHIS